MSLSHWIAAPALLACLSSCAATGTAPPGPITRDSATVVDQAELVALAAGPATADRIAAEAVRRGFAVERRDTLAALDRELIVLRIAPETDVPGAIRTLERAAPGSVVGRNHAYRPDPASSPSPGDPRSYAAALLSWPAAGCPATIRIGMIDTPLNPDAAGLAGAHLTTRDFTGGAPAGLHGTAVAELLAGPGRLTDAELYHAAVVGPASGRSDAAGVDDILLALDWLASENVRLVNISLAGPYNKILDRGLVAAVEHGMTIVAAAGNEGNEAPPRWPAASPGAIAVTAIDADLAPYGRAPRGDWLDFAAPGVDVYVSLPEGGRYLSGTSVATAFVTAIAAADPDGGKAAAQTRAQLARNSRDLGPTGPDDMFGVGLPTTPERCRNG
jgi:hypothetical protein